MTRATETPVRRVVIVEDRFGVREYVAEVRARTLTLRPAKTRRGGPQEVDVPFGALYQRLVEAKVDAARRAKRKGRRR